MMETKFDRLCRTCARAKDHYSGKGAEACYCTQYGFIVSKPKYECRGYEGKGGDADGGDFTGSNGRDS